MKRREQGYLFLNLFCLMEAKASKKAVLRVRCLRSVSFIGSIYLFGVLRRFQHYSGHIMMGSWKGRGNQYIQFARVVYCKLPTNGKQLPAFPLKAITGIEPRPQRWEARVLPLCYRGPFHRLKGCFCDLIKHNRKVPF